MAGALKITLKTVVPFIPDNEAAKAMLCQNLDRMGCVGLLQAPWCLKDAKMVRELVEGAPNQFEGTIRASPAKWTAEEWRQVYGFQTNGNGLCGRKQKYVGTTFQRNPDKHDGYAVEDCLDQRTRTCLAFLAPILNPEKPHRLTVRLANTIIGAYSGEREVDWGVLIRDTIEKLVRNIGKTRPTPISPFLYHLYRKAELLTRTEEEEYAVGLEMAEQGVEESEDEDDEGEAAQTDDDEEGDEEDGSEDEGPDPAPAPEARVLKKDTAPDGRGAPPSRRETSGAPAAKAPVPKPAAPRPHVPSAPAGQSNPGLEQHADPMTNLVYALGYARTEYENMRNAITGLCTEFGVSSLPELKTVIDRRPTVEDVKSLEQRAAQMTMEIGRLRELVKLKDTELGKTRTLMEAAHQDVVRIAGMCEVPATTMLNSNLYEAGISQSEVFKSETFKKFLKSTMAYTKRIEESNKTVVEVLESVRSRISEAGPRPAPTFESPAKVPVSRLSPAQLQRTGAGPSNPTTPTDKGKGPSG